MTASTSGTRSASTPPAGPDRIGPAWTGWALSAAATLVWLVAVISTGMLGRVAGHWESAATMAAGSFLAGSSPEGGGAVAFPVFTKALQVPAPVARTFGLSIQAVGMTMAVASILLARRPVHGRAVVVGSLAAVTAFLIGLGLLGDPDALFWPSIVPGAWVKATFSIVLATTSILMVRHLARARAGDEPSPMGWTWRLDLVVAVAAAAGGLLSSMTGTGANIMLFLALVVVADVRPKVALPSAIMVMAAVSVVGLVVLGLFDGQLDVAVVGDQVVSVGGRPVSLMAAETDLLGLWLAAAPVVVWGAPLGSLVASLARERQLVRFVAALAVIEVVTTFLLVEELRRQPALIIYLVGGLVLLPASFMALRRRRHRLLGSVGSPTGIERSLSP
ncbi:MAG: TSUP family transporter [Actinomycetota bacterium]